MDRRLRLPLAVLAGLLLLWGGGWFVVAKLVEDRVVAWIERERALGNRLVYRDLQVEGFPFGWRLVASQYEIGRDLPTTQVIAGARLEATLTPWDLTDVPMRLPGKHRYERREATSVTALELEAGRPDLRLRLHPGGRIAEIDVDLGDATARPPGAADAEAVRARRVRVTARAIDPADPGSREFFNVSISLDEVTPPASWQAPFNRPLRSGDAVIGVRGERVRNPNAAEQLLAWRNSGGVVELHRLQLDWAPLFVTGDGTGGLDRQNRPEAAFALRIAGYEQVLDGLVQTGQLGARQAALFTSLLAGMAKQDPATGRREVRIPITAQNGRLAVAGIPMMTLPPIPLPAR
jgi:hypothetical protein